MIAKLALGVAAAAVTCAVWSGSVAAEMITYFRTDTPEFLASAKLGKELFTSYQCALCHATREGQPLTKDIIAPNLILAKERLRPEWMLAWIIDPQTLQPGTKMPNFFSFNEDDDGNLILSDPDAHTQYKMIVALRDYLMVLGTDKEAELDRLGTGSQPMAQASEPESQPDIASEPVPAPLPDPEPAP
jgi:cytochrome c2